MREIVIYKYSYHNNICQYSMFTLQQIKLIIYYLFNSFLSYFVPLFQNESSCKTIYENLSYSFTLMHIKQQKVLHEDSFWNRGTR